MLIVIGLMLCGIVLGYIFGERDLSVVPKLITYAILALLFLLGVSVGTNRRIMDDLASIGLEALLITCGALTGSVICAWGIYTLYFKK